ncbi:Kelch repeat-containing protein [Amycolatopsis sp. NPDC049868]|uniref:Kelch repeat-containing protein n=1 Tax=Amycolatopsis sp. NPDC049868 TaxID=3363934 RepID=UPI003794F45E
MRHPLGTPGAPRRAVATSASISAPAAAPGTWVPTTGNLPAAAYWGQPDAAAVLLDVLDGKQHVLFAGGEDGRRTALGDCARYEIGSGTWTATGPLWTSRRLHSVTKLKSGKVLVTGGITGPVSSPATGIGSAEIYDPGPGKWSPVASMHEPRYSHSATLLPDGKVLVAGGCAVRSPRSHRALRSAEIYDPATDQWTVIDPMTDTRFGHPALRIKGDKVLMVGGIVTAGQSQYAPLAYCELFDPVTRKWTPTGSLASPRKGHQATELSDGTVLVTGGDIPDVMNEWQVYPYSQWSCERYNPDTGTWAADTDLGWGISHHRAVRLSTGKVLVIGGTDDGTFDIGYTSVALYDPGPKTWVEADGLTVGRWAGAAVALPGDKALVAGGIVRSGAAAPTIGEDLLTATAEVFTL